MSSAESLASLRLLTLGVYGFTEAAFFGALRQAGVDTFCDVRCRRGVRGREYAFANHRRLEAQLARMGIRYLHFHNLAPSPALRARQSAADRLAHVPKRKRIALSEDFIRGYRKECLRRLDVGHFRERLGREARVIALFCVERDPAACHRSLLAARLQVELDCEVSHLTPD
jgi:uncharacterized protein (DUF488 family)